MTGIAVALRLTVRYAPFFPRLTLAHLARWAAAILRRAETDMVRLPRLVPFAIETTFWPLTFAHRARCAAAIRARPFAEILR